MTFYLELTEVSLQVGQVEPNSTDKQVSVLNGPPKTKQR